MSDSGEWWAIEKFCREESITRPRTPGPGDRWLLAEHAFHKRGRAYSKTPLGWWERAWAGAQLISATAVRLFSGATCRGNHWKCELEKDLRFAYESNVHTRGV